MSTLDDVRIELSVLLGTVNMPVHQFLRMGRGAVIALDTLEDEPLQVLANGVPVARGEVVLEEEHIAVVINELIPRARRKAAA